MNHTYHKILFTHDGSDLASEAIDHVVTLAKAFDAEVIVIHVVDSIVKIIDSVTSTNMAIGTETIYKDLARREKTAAQNNLKRVQKQLQDAGLNYVSTMILQGDARDEIISAARDNTCDLIVMSTHGRSGIRRALLGSVAEDVVRHSPCPVFLVHVKK